MKHRGGAPPSLVVAAMICLLAWEAPSTARPAERIALTLLEFDLPGPPVEVFHTDFDGDGVSDLLILVAYTTWDQITTSEQIQDDEVEGLIEMMTVVPALADRRELFLLRGRSAGGFEPLQGGPGAGHRVSPDVASFVAGPSSAPVLALDREGLTAVRLVDDAGDGTPGIEFERLLSKPSVLSDVAELLPGLSLTHDIDGDGELDLFYPRPGAFDVYLGSDPGFASGGLSEPVASILLPGREERELSARRMHYPLPRFEDLDSDGLDDLILLHPTRRFDDPWVAASLGKGRFGSLERPLRDWRKSSVVAEGTTVFVGDVDGDGFTELVVEETLTDENAKFREEMQEAKEPRYRYRLYPVGDGFRPGEERLSFTSTGYAFGSDSDAEFPLPGGFQDLDGDGRLDLVTITLDFSLMQVVRIMVTRSISIGLDFHVRCQLEDGTFRKVEGLDLSGKFKMRLDDMRLGQLSQFAGDFDGDGRADFLQLGRGRKVSIHRGREGCGYPTNPDLTFRLRQEPRNLSLVRVGDFDGDGLADLMVVQPRRVRGRTRTAASDASTLPVTLEMYLSRGGGR